MKVFNIVFTAIIISFAPCSCLVANEVSLLVDASNDHRSISGELIQTFEEYRHQDNENQLAHSSATSVLTISLSQAKRLHELGAVFIDIRSDNDWRIGHIERALHYDFYDDFNRLQENSELNKETPLVIYCESSECLNALYASAISLFWGFDRVFYFQDGYFAWLLKDYPIRTMISYPGSTVIE